MKSERFQIKRKLGEGSFAVVVQAYDTQRKCHVAIKCLKDKFRSLKFALEDPEIQIFRCLPKHPNIVNLLEVLYLPSQGRLSLVFEYMDWSLYDFIMESPKYAQLTDNDLKFIFYQISNGIAHLHAQGIFHRDVKPENILIDSKTLQVKIADFGCCKGIYNTEDLTEYISTRFYRPPECAILKGYYGKSMDIWAIACVFFEVLTTEPMFPGNSSIDQVGLINSIIGSPSPDLLNFYFKHDFDENIDFREQRGFGIQNYLMMFHSRFGKFERKLVDLLGEMLHQDPKLRISAEDVLRSPFFRGLDVTQKYSQFCFKDEQARANELFHKLMVRHKTNRERTLDVLRNSLSVIRQSQGPFQKGIQKQLLEEQVVRKMAKTKSINQKIQIRQHFRQMGDDILELGKLGAYSDVLGKLISNETSPHRSRPKPKRPPGRKNKKRRRRSQNADEFSIKADQHLKADASGNFRSEHKPKISHFPSISNSNQASIMKLSTGPKCLSNILNISKFELGSSELLVQSNLDSRGKNRQHQKKSTFVNLRDSDHENNFRSLKPNVKSEMLITHFKEEEQNQSFLGYKHAKSIFGFQEQEQKLNLDLNKITSIVKANQKQSNQFFKSSGSHAESETFRPESTFENIELVSNIFSQAEQTETELNENFSKLFSFNNSEEILENRDSDRIKKSNPKLDKQKQEKREKGKSGKIEKPEKEIAKEFNQNEEQVPKFDKNKESEGTTLETSKSISGQINRAKQAKQNEGTKKPVNIKKLNKKSKKKVGIKRKNRFRTPLAVVKNQKIPVSHSKPGKPRKSLMTKSKQIRASQNQRMSEIFMNVIKV